MIQFDTPRGRLHVVLQGEGRLSRRKDGKYFVYLPKSVADDSAFPFKLQSSASVPVRVVIDPKDGRILVLREDKRKRKLRDQVSDQLAIINPIRYARVRRNDKQGSDVNLTEH